MWLFLSVVSSYSFSSWQAVFRGWQRFSAVEVALCVVASRCFTTFASSTLCMRTKVETQKAMLNCLDRQKSRENARESAALARQRRAESASGTYDRFSNRDGFGDGTFGSRPNRPGFDRPNRPGFGKPRGRAAGRLRRDADGNFVRTPAKGGEQ